MTEENFSIPSRQKSDVLFESDQPLGAGASFATGVARTTGYAQVSIFAVSDQPFSIIVEEAVIVKPDGTGNFAQTQATLNSVSVGGIEQVATRITPFGNFMKMVLTNPGGTPEAYLNFLVQGLPVS
jgi:hypothetical protein